MFPFAYWKQLRKVERTMTDFATALATLTSLVAKNTADTATAVAEIGTLKQSIADLQAQVAAGASGDALQPAIDAITASVASLEGALPAPPAEPAPGA